MAAEALNEVRMRHFNAFRLSQDPDDSSIIGDGDILDNKDLPSESEYTSIREVPSRQWVILGCVTAALCLLDALVLRHLGTSFLMHVVLLAVWVALGFAYCGFIFFDMGPDSAADWATGYLLEWMLSVDNLLVFNLVFRSYKVPPAQIPKAVFVGIFGAVIMRLLFYWALSDLLNVVVWVRMPVGLLLVWSGIEAARADDDDQMDLSETRLIRLIRRCLGSRLHEGYDEQGGGLFMFDSTGTLQITMLFIVVCCIELADILFAVDSVTAKVAQINDQYIAFSSSVLAMFGLRSMFFIIDDLVSMFSMLKYGLGVVLVFIGFELILSPLVELSSSTVCIIIATVFLMSIAGSLSWEERLARGTTQAAKSPRHTASVSSQTVMEPSTLSPGSSSRDSTVSSQVDSNVSRRDFVAAKPSASLEASPEDEPEVKP